MTNQLNQEKMSNLFDIKFIDQEPFLKRITRMAKRTLITKLTTPVVTEINIYNDKKVVNVKANIPFHFLRSIS